MYICCIFSSWRILRSTPSIFEVSQLRQRSQLNEPSARDAAARARSQYEASMNATVSLSDMLGNPLEISNELLVHQAPTSDSHVDIYHAATTYAQLHRVSIVMELSIVSTLCNCECC